MKKIDKKTVFFKKNSGEEICHTPKHSEIEYSDIQGECCSMYQKTLLTLTHTQWLNRIWRNCSTAWMCPSSTALMLAAADGSAQSKLEQIRVAKRRKKKTIIQHWADSLLSIWWVVNIYKIGVVKSGEIDHWSGAVRAIRTREGTDLCGY